jgi:hypothetical protein
VCDVAGQDHHQLGQAGDIVKVKAGHARYILFPRGEADYAMPAVLKQLKVKGAAAAAAAAGNLHNLGRACDNMFVSSNKHSSSIPPLERFQHSSCTLESGTWQPPDHCKHLASLLSTQL